MVEHVQNPPGECQIGTHIQLRQQLGDDLARILVVLAIMLLANSPLLDFRKISLASQLRMVESGEKEWHAFDFWYTKHHLARPGYLAMQQIKQEIAELKAEISRAGQGTGPRQ